MTLSSLWAIFTEPVSLGFLAAVMAVVAINLATVRRQIDADAMLLSYMLVAAWLFTKLLAWCFEWPFARSTYPLTDLVEGLAVLYLCVNRPVPWKAVLLMIFCAKAMAHLEIHPEEDTLPSTLYLYRLTLDILFAAELLAVASSGGRIVGDRVTAWVLRGSGRRDLVQSGARQSHPQGDATNGA